MWESLFGGVSFNNTLKNVGNGVNRAVKVLTSLNSSPTPPPVETSKISTSVDLEIANAFIDSEKRSTTLLGNLIADPYAYQNLSQSDKILVTRIAIEDLKNINKKYDHPLTNPITSIISRIETGNDRFINEYEAIEISNYYIGFNKATKSKPHAKTPLSFQCQRITESKIVSREERRGRRSQNAFAPPPPFWTSKQDRTPAQQHRSDEMHRKMLNHIANEREKRSMHPASIKPQTNLATQPEQTQKPLTGPGARDAVLGRRGLRPTNFQSGDATRANEEHLEKIGKYLAKLEFELSQTKISKSSLYKVKYRPDLGSYNRRRTEEYGNEASNKQKEIDALTKNLLTNYSQDEINKVYASKTQELTRLKNAPKTAPKKVRGDGPLAGSFHER